MAGGRAADLLVCMPGPGDRIKMGFDEIRKLIACMYNIPTSKKSKHLMISSISNSTMHPIS